MIWAILAFAVTADVTFPEAKREGEGFRRAGIDSQGRISALEIKGGISQLGDLDGIDEDEIDDDEEIMTEAEMKGMNEMMNSEAMNMLGDSMVKTMMAMRKTLILGLMKGMTKKLKELQAMDSPDPKIMKKMTGRMMLLMSTVDAMKDEIFKGLKDDDKEGGAKNAEKIEQMKKDFKKNALMIGKVRDSMMGQMMDDIMQKIKTHITAYLTMQGVRRMEESKTEPSPGEMKAEVEKIMNLKYKMEMQETRATAMMKTRAAMEQGISNLIDQILDKYMKDADKDGATKGGNSSVPVLPPATELTNAASPSTTATPSTTAVPSTTVPPSL